MITTMGVRAKIETSNPRLLNSWLLFVTILVIVVAFGFYSFVYVKNNEKDQIAKRFRVLAQMGENIIKKEKGFRGIAENAGKVIDNKKELEEIKNEIKKINRILKVSKTKPGQGSLEFADIQGKSEPYYIYVSAEDFFDPLKRPDVFEEFIVLEEKKKPEEGNKQNRSDNPGTICSVIYHTFPGDINISGADELKSFKNGIESGCFKEVNIANKNYKLFLQAVKLSNGSSGEKWYVGGLIDEKKFTRETRELKAGTIVPFIITFFLFILAIPLIKLFLMSKFEQLDNNDVILNTLSITFGTILIILLVLFLHQKTSDTNNIQENLEALAQKLKVNFTVELQKAFKQLKKYDRDFKNFHFKSNDDSIEFALMTFDNVTNLLSETKFEPPPSSDKYDEKIKIFKERFKGGFNEEFKRKSSPSIYNLFKIVFWMDSTGQQVLQFFSRNYFEPLSELGHRTYFQDAGNWKLPGFPHLTFMLESITSVTSGEKLAAISMRSELQLENNGKNLEKSNPIVAAMTTQLTSLIDTIVPVGYGFCIIDAAGHVWFHSNSQRNLQENFIDEVEKDKELLSAIYGNQSKYIDLDYQSRDHKCFVMPLPNIPLYIVAFHDMAYTNSVQSYILINTLVFLVTLLAFNGFLFVITAVINYRKSLLKRKYVPFEWLRPLNKEKGEKQEKEEKRDVYRHLIITNLVIGLFLIIFKLIVDGTGTFFLCISAILFSFTFNYFMIIRENNKKYRLGNYVLLIFFLVFLLLIDFIAWLIMDKFLLLIMFQDILLIFGLIKITRYKSPGDGSKSRIYNFFEKKFPTYTGVFPRQSYVCFLLSWLVLICFIPTIMFYLDAYRHENEVALKYHQLKLAQHIETRNFEIDKFYREKMDNTGVDSIVNKTKEQRKHSGIYANIIANTRVNPDEHLEPAAISNNNNFDKILYSLKPSLSPIAVEKRNLVFPTSADRSRTWWKANNKMYLEYRINNSLENNNNGSTKQTRNNNRLYFVSNIKSHGIFSSGFSLLLFGTAVFLILVLAYFLTRIAARKIFSLNLPGCGSSKRTYSDTETEIREAVKAGSNLIIYCQTEKEMEYCVKLFDNESPQKNKPLLAGNSNGKSKIIKADFFDVNSDKRKLKEVVGDGAGKILLVKNFQLYVNDIQGNLKKINLVIPLLRSQEIQTVIPTFTPLMEIIEYYGEILSRLTTKKTGDPTFPEEMKLRFKEIIDLLNEANDYLVTIYPRLKTISQNPANEQPNERPLCKEINDIKDESVKTLILNEFKSFEYFENIQDSVGSYSRELEKENENPGEKNSPLTKEKIILKIQELSHHFYNQLWNSCTRKERYVLYDAAQNMLVNCNNIETITILLKKGLMVYDGTYKLMNKSFRNFILSSITPGEARDLVRGLNGQGNWKSYKAPLLLIAMGVAVFLAFQDSLLSNVNAIVTTVIGGLAMLTKVSGIFSNVSLSSSK